MILIMQCSKGDCPSEDFLYFHHDHVRKIWKHGFAANDIARPLGMSLAYR